MGGSPDTPIVLAFDLITAASPQQVQGSADPRVLAFGIESIGDRVQKVADLDLTWLF